MLATNKVSELGEKKITKKQYQEMLKSWIQAGIENAFESGITSNLPVNKDGNIVFYHGTTVEGANSIRANGVDLKYATRDMDFGKGFYVTINEKQANAWATKLGRKYNLFCVRPHSQYFIRNIFLIQ